MKLVLLVSLVVAVALVAAASWVSFAPASARAADPVVGWTWDDSVV